jgi:predicted small metal-binding protein
VTAEASSKHSQLVARCDCGFEVRGDTDHVVDGMQKHAQDVHNMVAPREAILERARPA